MHSFSCCLFKKSKKTLNQEQKSPEVSTWPTMQEEGNSSGPPSAIMSDEKKSETFQAQETPEILPGPPPDDILPFSTSTMTIKNRPKLRRVHSITYPATLSVIAGLEGIDTPSAARRVSSSFSSVGNQPQTDALPALASAVVTIAVERPLEGRGSRSDLNNATPSEGGQNQHDHKRFTYQ